MKLLSHLFPAILLLGSFFGAQGEITVCSEEGNTTCAIDNRICLLDTSDTVESCGNCTVGYINLDFLITEVHECLLIDGLPWLAFFELFKPVYKETGGVTIEDRLLRLYAVLNYISNFLAQIPPAEYVLSPNMFSADTLDDAKHLRGYLPLDGIDDLLPRFEVPDGNRMLQDTLADVNWIEKGGTTYIKQQGRCGSCWAVALSASIEGATFVNDGYLQSMSYQQFISCDKDDNGCDGGNIVRGMNYAWQKSGGIASLLDYPYSDADGTTSEDCLLDQRNVSVFITDPRTLYTYSDRLTYQEREDKMKLAVSRSPVTMALKSNCNIFSSYHSGIVTDDGDCACDHARCIDHAVVLVGYQTSTSPPYWIMRNSWGDSWGEDGYMRIAMKNGNSGEFGLFGMLGEGVIPIEATNVTSQKAEQHPSDDERLEWYWILLIALACLVALCMVGACFKLFCCKK